MIDIDYQCLDKSAIDYFHANNILINTWTVNVLNVAEQLSNAGADYIITDILE